MHPSKYTTPKQVETMRAEILREKQKAAGGRPVRAVKWKRILKITEWVVFLGVFAVLVISLIGIYTAKSRGETPALFGVYQLYAVETGSMEPTLSVGSVIVCKKIPNPETLDVNQIVTFHTRSGAVVTHRIISVLRDETGRVSYRTKGDNPINSPDDEPLTPDRVIGVFVAKIPLT